MKALVYKKYGPPEVLELRDAPKPVQGREVLVRIHTTTVTRRTAECRSILGIELAGVVEATGIQVTRFKPATRSLPPPSRWVLALTTNCLRFPNPHKKEMA